MYHCFLTASAAAKRPSKPACSTDSTKAHNDILAHSLPNVHSHTWPAHDEWIHSLSAIQAPCSSIILYTAKLQLKFRKLSGLTSSWHGLIFFLCSHLPLLGTGENWLFLNPQRQASVCMLRTLPLQWALCAWRGFILELGISQNGTATCHRLKTTNTLQESASHWFSFW